MMPHEPVRDIMRRTVKILKFIEASAGKDGPFEVTQLINSFLGALAHPWETFQDDLNAMPLEAAGAAGWPVLKKELSVGRAPESVGDLVRPIRNSVAHGNVEFLPGSHGVIRALRIWNVDPRTGKQTWSAVVTVEMMRALLLRFVDLAENLHERQERLRPRTA